MRLWMLAGAAMLVLGGCGGGGLRNLDSGTAGPDEFAILPVDPLVMPENLSVLPRPTPGQPNLADPDPKGDAVAALGGRPAAALASGGVPAADAVLIARVSRHGTDPEIRARLAAEDAAFRRNRGRFGLFSTGNRYFKAYASQALDAYAELQRFRNLGVRTPSAPPPGE